MANAAYVAASRIAATGMVLFAHAPNIGIAIVASLLVSGMGFPTIRVAATILVNRRTASDTRATVHSLLSQAENLGETLCGLLLAGLAARWSRTITLGSARAFGGRSRGHRQQGLGGQRSADSHEHETRRAENALMRQSADDLSLQERDELLKSSLRRNV